jgi:HD-like signal output (HDOD) protein
VGKVILDKYFHEEFLQIMNHVSSVGTTFREAGNKVLGTTHYQIAAKLFKQWKFPDMVTMQVLYHHAPRYDIHYMTKSNIFTKLAGYTCHPDEQAIDLAEFANSPEMAFVNKSGFALDYETMEDLNGQIQASVAAEADNVMTLFG